MTSTSEIRWHGEQQSTHCGYCPSGAKPHSVTFGFTSKLMFADDYDALMTSGWRRCGEYYYKPTMHKTCCPQYTIRCKASTFKPSRDQSLVLRRLDRYLRTGSIKEVKSEKSSNPDSTSTTTVNENKTKYCIRFQTGHCKYGDTCRYEHVLSPETIEKNQNAPKRKPFEKPKTVQPECTEPMHKWTTTTQMARFTEEEYQLYCKYQKEVHNDTDEDLSVEGYTRFLVNSSLRPRPKGAATGSAVITASASPSEQKPRRTFPYGTYHQCHRIDGKLVAVGVVDLLPSGLSSVYLFYDTDYRELVLGKVCALKELEFAVAQGLEYYYMGFYIASCTKMKYKGEYQPAELLCPTTLRFFPFQEATEKLQSYRFSPFDTEYSEKRKLISTPDVVSSSSSAENPSNDAISIAPSSPSLVASKLNTFAPQFARNPPCDYKSLLLEISPQKIFTIDSLTAQGKKIVKPMLLEFLGVCGPTIDCTRLRFVFHNN